MPVRAAPLLLASASPRRKALLEQIGIHPHAISPAVIDESARPGELPRDLARRLAMDKAEAAAVHHPDMLILAADTVVAVGRRILPKPEDMAEAGRFLRLLSGRQHRVFGGICLLSPDGHRSIRVVETRVRFKRLSPAELDRYLDGGEWHDKAGGYAIQGHAAAFVRGINGSYTNVVGLSLYDVNAMLAGLTGHPGEA